MFIRAYCLLIVTSTFGGCLSVGTKCCDYVGTYPVADGLYVERYRTYCAGVFGELTDCYLTDSASFRQKIGTYDEHERLRVNLDKGSIITFNIESHLISDTVERKTMSESQLFQYNHSDTNVLSTKPVFGTNTIKCDSNFYPAWSYVTDDGYHISQVQYKCGKEISNAVFYTDSLKFSVFIGVYCPGELNNKYSVKMKGDGSFDFFNLQDLRKFDTVYSQTYDLKNLKKAGFAKMCKKK